MRMTFIRGDLQPNMAF